MINLYNKHKKMKKQSYKFHQSQLLLNVSLFQNASSPECLLLMFLCFIPSRPIYTTQSLKLLQKQPKLIWVNVKIGKTNTCFLCITGFEIAACRPPLVVVWSFKSSASDQPLYLKLILSQPFTLQTAVYPGAFTIILLSFYYI